MPSDDRGPAPQAPPGAEAIRFRVRYAETDAMGVVHHSRYFPWFEMGRTEFIRTHGYTYRELELSGVLLAVIEAQAHYRAPAAYDDSILLYTWLAEFGRVRLRFAYQVYNETSGRLLADGETTHAFIGRDGRPIRLARQNPAAWERLQAISRRAHAGAEGESDGAAHAGGSAADE